MNAQDNPFGALDKLLFSPVQGKPKEDKPLSDEPTGQLPQVSPTPPSKNIPKSAGSIPVTPSPAKLQSRSVAKTQVRKKTNLPSRQTAKVQNDEIAKSQLRKDADSQERRTAKSQVQERKSINHGLNIYEDQLFRLKEIQLERQRAGVGKYSLGDLAKEALDIFIRQERKKA